MSLPTFAYDRQSTSNKATSLTAPLQLHLEVFVNGASSQLIALFYKLPDGALLIEPDQLINVGIRPQKTAFYPAVPYKNWIDVLKLSGVKVSIDDKSQTINFTANETNREPRIINAGDGTADTPDDQLSNSDSSYGGVLNYVIYAATGGNEWKNIGQFDGASALADARFFGPYGIFSTSQILRTSDTRYNQPAIRLDTRWSYSNPDTLITYNAGDIITGGLGWSRPVRLGGIQIRRNFSLRPDLVTMPLPELSGSAAVPSTIDVYVNNARRFSQSVGSGPFSITNLPVVSGNGIARIVLRDALGRETISETPFYTSSTLLAKGLIDFSAETGFARRYYGTQSNNYDGLPVGSLTARYGMTNNLTFEMHAEAAQQFYNIGTGSVFNIGSLGIGAVSGSASQYRSETGYQIAASVEAQFSGARIFVRTQRSYGNYNDIASVTAEIQKYRLPFLTLRTPKALDQLSISMPSFFAQTNLNLSYTQMATAEQKKSRILGLTAARPVGSNGNLFLSAYTDLEHHRAFGAFAGLSWSFDNNVTASSSVAADTRGTIITSEIMKSEQMEIGSSGWRLRGSYGQNKVASATGSYRARSGRIEATAEKFNNHVRANAQIEGAVVIAGGGVFLTNRIDDAFGVINVGAPDVDVQFENRSMGKTGKNGKILLPNLRAYEDNVVTIDPANLPVYARVTETRKKLKPRDRSAAIFDFKVKADNRAALITLRDEAGNYIQPGATAQLNGKGEYIIGYDGQLYLEQIEASNHLRVQNPGKSDCEVQLDNPLQTTQRIAISHVICKAIP